MKRIILFFVFLIFTTPAFGECEWLFLSETERLNDNERLTQLLEDRRKAVEELMNVRAGVFTKRATLSAIIYETENLKENYKAKYGEEELINHLLAAPKLHMELNINNYKLVSENKIVLAALLVRQKKTELPVQLAGVVKQFAKQDSSLAAILNHHNDEQIMAIAKDLKESLDKVERNIKESLRQVRILLSIVNGEVPQSSPYRAKVDELVVEYVNFLNVASYTENSKLPKMFFLFKAFPVELALKPSIHYFYPRKFL